MTMTAKEKREKRKKIYKRLKRKRHMTAKEEIEVIRKLNESMFCHCPKCGHKHFKKLKKARK